MFDSVATIADPAIGPPAARGGDAADGLSVVERGGAGGGPPALAADGAGGGLPAVEGCDADGCLSLMAAVRKRIAGLEAVMLRAQARFAALRPTLAGEAKRAGPGWAAEEIAAELALSPAAAAAGLELAVTVVDRLPATLTALEAGDIDLGRVRAVAESTAALPAEKAATVEQRVLARGGRASHSLFRQALRRAVLATDPDGARRRHAHARTERQVQLRTAEDGMAELWALLPAVDAQAAYQRLDALARQVADPQEAPGMDARRADALVDLLLGRDRGAEVSVEVGVLVSAATLAGASDVPGELAGYGPIPAALARELATDATWRRVLTDPAQGDRPVEVSRRFPAPGLARLLRTRQRTCRFPGCRKPARFCDLDHIQPHSTGGPTSEENLLTLCRRHHRAKHDGGWMVQRTDSDTDTVLWTAPTGRTYPSVPEPWDDPAPPTPPAST
ncbi:HNH endonuclease signature motif containing protein, partial [Frankia sp. CiP1_Cm_nod1]|uniref:HNH endonuclease signature motif containing protein n=1 Tax=Frankia sp. CiP1_Cm_nod1 TaxID=2897160 RepID=UPI0020241E32